MYNKKTWNDRRVQYPNRRQLVQTGTEGTVDIQRAEGSVYTIGDKFNAETMNNLEDRISNAFNTFNNQRKPITITNKVLSSSGWSSATQQSWDYEFKYKFRQWVSVSGMSSSDIFLQGTQILNKDPDGLIEVFESASGGFYVYATEKPTSTVTINQVVYLKGA